MSAAAFPLVLILTLVIIDYGSGLIGSIANGTFNSSKAREGLLHKFAYAIVLVVTVIIEKLAVYYDLGYVYADALFTLVCIWIIITEVGSILENVIKINPSLADNDFMQIFANQHKADQAARKEEQASEIVSDVIIEDEEGVNSEPKGN